MKVEKEKLKPLIEDHLHPFLQQDSYYLKHTDARLLLTHSRFDLAFKLSYLGGKYNHWVGAREIYQEHIKALTLGKYVEPGNEQKNSIERYFQDFESVDSDIRQRGFDPTVSVIPLSQTGAIANGAHRVASAIFHTQRVSCVSLASPNHTYDYTFFKARGVPDAYLDAAASAFVQHASNCFVAMVWPSAQGHDKELERIFERIVYRKNISLSENGAHNLLSQIYSDESWLGSVENNYKGSHAKLRECFRGSGPLRVFLFQCDSLDEVLKLKEEVRKIFKIGKHSIHITDTRDEATQAVQLLLNNNSVHFLNFGKPNKFMSTHHKLREYRTEMKRHNINFEKLVIDGGLVLSVYGLRECRDIDFFADDSVSSRDLPKSMDIHDDMLSFHQLSKSDLLFNSRYHFYYGGLKFIALVQLTKMKQARGEDKDKLDCQAIQALISGNHFSHVYVEIRQRLRFVKIILIHGFADLLKKLGVYLTVRKIYRYLRGKFLR